jgi:hypothetical protein
VDDHADVSACVARFFAAFSTAPGVHERLDALTAQFLPHATVTHFTPAGELVVDDVPSFVEPRRAYLTSGAVTAFREWPLPGELKVRGNVAVWSGPYAKEGRGPGGPLAGSGFKVIQLVRVGGQWRITSVVWEDDPIP